MITSVSLAYLSSSRDRSLEKAVQAHKQKMSQEGAPRTDAVFTSPLGKNVTDKCATPEGLEAPRQVAARLAPRPIARAIAFSVAT